ncbi:unnamed protein product [Penicillium salamii]|nr:unnamed protein product [Penicillium salamii]
MHISTQVEASLATALLLASFVLFVLSRRAVQKSRLHRKLDLAVSAPNLVLLAVHMGLSWSKTCETGREVMIGVSSLFPFLLVYLRISVFLRSLLSAPSQLVICFPLYTVVSCLIKIMATTAGVYIFPPLRIVVLFSLFLDNLGLVAFLWWLDGHTTANSRTLSQLRCALYCMIGVAVVLLLIAVLGAALSCWLLALELQILIVTVWMIPSYFAVQNAGASAGEQLTFATSEATNESTAHTIKDFIGGLSQDCYRRAFNCQEVSPAAPGQV